MKQKVLVCGSTGFIGRNIAERLALRDDIEVYGTHFKRSPPDNSRINPVLIDLTDASQVNQAVQSMDIIIHAAATTSGSKDIITRPFIHVTDNAVMNSLLMRAAYEHDVKHFVFFSCTVMYQASEKPVAESDFNGGDEIFPIYFGVGWTKVYTEKMCEFFSRLGKNKFTVIRHSNVYGPHDKYDLERSHVLGATITKVMTNTSGILHVWGPGTEKRDLLYVSDLVDFVELALAKQQTPFELVNIGSGEATEINDLVQEIIRISGKNITIKHDLSKPHIPTRLCLDISKAREIFGWQPATSLYSGIKKSIAWYRAYKR